MTPFGSALLEQEGSTLLDVERQWQQGFSFEDLLSSRFSEVQWSTAAKNQHQPTALRPEPRGVRAPEFVRPSRSRSGRCGFGLHGDAPAAAGASTPCFRISLSTRFLPTRIAGLTRSSASTSFRSSSPYPHSQGALPATRPASSSPPVSPGSASARLPPGSSLRALLAPLQETPAAIAPALEALFQFGVVGWFLEGERRNRGVGLQRRRCD